MCSRHPEEGAGSSYVEPEGYVTRRDMADVLHKAPQRPVWPARAVNGGWDVPKGHGDHPAPEEEVSND